MGIVNRTLDASEQKQTYMFNWSGTSGSIAVGTTLMSAPIPSPGVLQAAVVSCQGASVVPTSSLQVVRFIPGAGVTTISGLGASFVVPAIGISGVLSVSLVASGSTLLNLLAGDCFQMINGVNSVVSPVLSVVVKKTQDIATSFGSAT